MEKKKPTLDKKEKKKPCPQKRSKKKICNQEKNHPPNYQMNGPLDDILTEIFGV